MRTWVECEVARLWAKVAHCSSETRHKKKKKKKKTKAPPWSTECPVLPLPKHRRVQTPGSDRNPTNDDPLGLTKKYIVRHHQEWECLFSKSSI
jgi:hypothetical protein